MIVVGVEASSKEKTGRGDAVTEKIEKDPAARIQRSALKKKTQLHLGALKMIIPHSKSNRYIHHGRKAKEPEYTTFRPHGFIR